MDLLASFTTAEKQSHNTHKFAFTLSPTNYGYWKAMLQPFLLTHNLYGYIDGTIPCPPPYLPTDAATAADPKPEPRANPNHPVWISNDAHIRMLILSTIFEASFRHVQGTTSQELWISLEQAYAPHSSSREYTLKTQLLRIEMKGDETVDAYPNRAKEYSDALAAIGSPVSDKDLVMFAVSGLREEYNSLKSTIAGRQLPTTFTELHALLSDHDYMIGKTRVSTTPIVQAFHTTTNAVATPSASALAAQLSPHTAALNSIGFNIVPQSSTSSPSHGSQAYFGSRNNTRGSYTRGRRRSFHGNNNRDPNERDRQFDWASNQNVVYDTCNRCGIGHLPSQCPNTDPSTIRRSSANFAASHASTSSNTWLSDTSANNHVMPDLASMDDSGTYYGNDNLHGGDGKGLPILHIGSSHVHSANKIFKLSKILHVPHISKQLLSV